MANVRRQTARVLIVDDTPVTRESLNRMLTKLGYDVVGQANDGQDALDIYPKLRPDIVTMDIMMYPMDGFEATRRIKALDPEALVMMVSTKDDEESVKKAEAAGAVAYIVNPITMKTLKSKMDAVSCRIKRKG